MTQYGKSINLFKINISANTLEETQIKDKSVENNRMNS